MWALNELTNDEAPANVTVYKILGKKNKSMLSVPLSLFSQRSHQPDGGCVLTYLITRLVLKWKIIPLLGFYYFLHLLTEKFRNIYDTNGP